LGGQRSTIELQPQLSPLVSGFMPTRQVPLTGLH